MGGFGSGNRDQWWRPSKKRVVEYCLSLDANRWTRKGILRAGVARSGSWRWGRRRKRHQGTITYEVRTTDMACPVVRLSYSWVVRGEAKDSVDYPVRLTTTVPRFGGIRWWFRCPLLVRGGAPCDRRVGKLYLPPGGRYFGCRHCHRLTYTSCQESRKGDAFTRFIAGNLGCDLRAVNRIMRRFGK